ncbi:hypothetical protein SHKM778_58660 [Streptomyces sp. KM77-8]|uniref:FAD/NAD(P)-binding domain-containing protein n=1 Tax=Streptomyces haneummycinicus TaxID=3074435 RepID=A0AAT9HQ33_9ACTN
METSEGDWSTRALINATGTWDRPFWPRYPGQETFRGRQVHTSRYPGPEAFAGQRVIVVGGGASGTQHLLEIAPYAVATTWVTRRPPVFREGPFDEEAGRAAVALVEERVRQGLPPRSVVSVTGLPLNDAIRRGLADGVLDRQPMFDRITPDGVEWADGRRVAADVILWATGFRPSVEHLAPLRLREPGGGIRVEERGRSPIRGSIWSATAPRRAPSAPTGPGARRYGTSAGCWRRRNRSRRDRGRAAQGLSRGSSRRKPAMPWQRVSGVRCVRLQGGGRRQGGALATGDNAAGGTSTPFRQWESACRTPRPRHDPPGQAPSASAVRPCSSGVLRTRRRRAGVARNRP